MLVFLSFEKGWGNDELIISEINFFRHFNFNKYEMKGYDGSFHTLLLVIIFGDGIKRDDLAWSGDTLINLKTNDTIEY